MNIVGHSNDDNNILHKVLLTDTQVSSICKSFANDSSANIKLSKTQLSKIVQLGEFLFCLTSNIFDSPILPIKEMTSLANATKNSFKKELQNTGTKITKLLYSCKFRT